MRNIEKETLKKLGYTLIQIPRCNLVYPEISSHVDIFCCKIKENLIIEKSIYNELFYEIIQSNKENFSKLLSGENSVGSNYPHDILYNVCVVGDFVIHNFKYTDNEILRQIEKLGLKKININQGYSKCSIAVIDENSVIVTDKSIAKILKKKGIETLCIEDKKNIKLLNKDNIYSNMNGFIGGCITRIDNFVFISGDLEKIDEDNKVRNFIESKNLKILDFKDLDVIDYGGIVKI